MPQDPASIRSDSVPPFSSTWIPMKMPGRFSRRAFAELLLVVAAISNAALLVSYALLPPSRNDVALARLASLVPKPPPPLVLVPDDEDVEPQTLAEQRARLFSRMARDSGFSQGQLAAVESIFAASPILGQGNPLMTVHPMSRSECRRIRLEASLTSADIPACGARGMVPLYDPSAGQTAKDASVCIDELEFPNLPCEYPVVHVRANEAAALCRAVGKRICDAHEWEGACAGALRSADVEYEWGRPREEATWYHNFKREKIWSYGSTQNQALCATGSRRSPECPGGGYEHCGSNTYPAGAFPRCHSPLGVFDVNGNVAEHMSLPIVQADLARNGDLGFTEMKGSWFVFSTIQAHEDDCRWRAPSWHETRIKSESSHYNYHLGFRCCKDIGENPQTGAE